MKDNLKDNYRALNCLPINEIPRTEGTYIIILEVKQDITISIGKLGSKELKEGLYVYVGSAFGPGGLRARVFRHLKRNKKKKWHIDFLTTNSNISVKKVVTFVSSKRLECVIARKILKNGGDVVIKKFGSTDCNCPSHLIKVNSEEELKFLIDNLMGKISTFCPKNK